MRENDGGTRSGAEGNGQESGAALGCHESGTALGCRESESGEVKLQRETPNEYFT